MSVVLINKKLVLLSNNLLVQHQILAINNIPKKYNILDNFKFGYKNKNGIFLFCQNVILKYRENKLPIIIMSKKLIWKPVYNELFSYFIISDKYNRTFATTYFDQVYEICQNKICIDQLLNNKIPNFLPIIDILEDEFCYEIVDGIFKFINYTKKLVIILKNENDYIIKKFSDDELFPKCNVIMSIIEEYNIAKVFTEFVTDYYLEY